jgi:hypothetical protein
MAPSSSKKRKYGSVKRPNHPARGFEHLPAVSPEGLAETALPTTALP